MNITKHEIMKLGEMLIRTKGYHSFSYADISKPLNIKNAAVHYHFPTKTDLGVAIVIDTIQSIDELIAKTSSFSSTEKIISFINIYDNSKNNAMVCIVGALSPCYSSLPNEIQEQLKILTNTILTWLQSVLQYGKSTGEFIYQEDSNIKAHTIIASLLASLLLQNSLNDNVFEIIKKSILLSLEI